MWTWPSTTWPARRWRPCWVASARRASTRFTGMAATKASSSWPAVSTSAACRWAGRGNAQADAGALDCPLPRSSRNTSGVSFHSSSAANSACLVCPVSPLSTTGPHRSPPPFPLTLAHDPQLLIRQWDLRACGNRDEPVQPGSRAISVPARIRKSSTSSQWIHCRSKRTTDENPADRSIDLHVKQSVDHHHRVRGSNGQQAA